MVRPWWAAPTWPPQRQLAWVHTTALGRAVVPDVGFGATPVGLISQVLRGADVALLLAGLILAGAGYPVRLAVATVALAWSLRTRTAD